MAPQCLQPSPCLHKAQVLLYHSHDEPALLLVDRAVRRCGAETGEAAADGVRAVALRLVSNELIPHIKPQRDGVTVVRKGAAAYGPLL